jgi:hypothetical protein
MSTKEHSTVFTKALLQLAGEDRGGFKPITTHRDGRVYGALERRGLVFRATTCRPETCQYRPSHGPVPGGDCRREGWQISLRGLLVVELLRSGGSLSDAEHLARSHEREYIAITVITRGPDGRDNGNFGSGPMLAKVDLPKPPARRARHSRGSKLQRLLELPPIEPAALPKPSTAELSADAELERLKFRAAQLADELFRIHCAHEAVERAREEIVKCGN